MTKPLFPALEGAEDPCLLRANRGSAVRRPGVHVFALVARVHQGPTKPFPLQVFALETLVAYLSSVGGRANHVPNAVFLRPPILDMAQIIHGVALLSRLVTEHLAQVADGLPFLRIAASQSP